MKIALFVCFLSLVISALSQITLEPKPLTGYEGEDVVVRCVHPPGVMNAQFELRVNGTVFNSHHPKYQSVSSTNTSASYTYGPLEQRTEQGITFTCDDGIGSTDEETITIYSITPMVAMSTQPAAVNSVSIQGTNYDSVFVETGDMVDVTCILISNPTFELYSITRSYKVQENGNLLVGSEANITSSRNGTTAYTITESIMVYCRAVVEGVTLQSESVIIAVVPYNLAIEADPGIHVEYGSSIILTCDAMGGPTLNYQWNLPSGMRKNGSVLVIDSVTDSDDGEYNCTVTSEAGKTSTTISVLVGVVLVQHPSSQLVDAGDVVHFTCTSSSSGPLSYQWHKDGTILSESSRVRGSSSSTLTINPVVSADFGNYTCRVMNPVDSMLSEPAVLTVSPKNLVTVTPRAALASQFEYEVLRCMSGGGPGNTFQWYHGNQLLFGETSYLLEITTVTPSDAGNYTCTVTNAAGSGSDVATLTVGVVLVQHPSSQLVEAGDVVHFTCTSSGSDPLSYQWWKDGTILSKSSRVRGSNSSTLTINPVVSTDFGNYSCRVNNPVDSMLSEPAVLTVSPKNLVTVTPRAALASQFEYEMLSCMSGGGPGNTFQWYHGNLLLSGETSYLLEIITVTPSDAGNYTCRVTNAAGSGSDVASLTVSPYNLVTVTPRSSLTGQYENVVFTCESEGGPGNTFEWYHGNQLLSGKTAPLLEIAMVTPSDAGDYNCTVTNAAGSGSDVATLTVGVVIDTQPMDALAEISEDASFYCEASGSEPISYAWFRENRTQVESGGRISGSDSSTLTITSVVSSDYGEYFCNVSNVVNSQRSDGAVLTVSPFGTVVVWPENSLVKESDNVTLTCSADGGPNNDYMWFYGSTSLTNGPVLELNNIRARDGGEYTCVVSNAAGSDRESVTISVDPVVISDPIGANITLFTSHMISCEARGSPQPIIVWYRNGSLINYQTARGLSVSVTTIHVVVHSELRFLNATFEYSGVYWCEARPIHLGGTPASSARVNITVQSVPERPVSVTVVDTTHISVLLVWIEPHDNNAKITSYEVSVRDDTNPDGLTTTQHTPGDVVMLNVTGLKPFTNYTFVVFANNSLGRSPPSAPLTTSTDEFIPTAPLDITRVNSSSSSIYISWKPPSTPNGVLISYTVTYTRLDTNVILDLTTLPDVKSVDVTMLSAFVTYRITVRAATSVGSGPDSEPLTVRTEQGAPGPLGNINITNTSSTSVRVTFDEPVLPNGIISAYEVNVTRGGSPRSRRALVESITVTDPFTVMTYGRDTREINIGGLVEYSENLLCMRAFTVAGGGEATCMTFVTAEDVPLAPLDLAVLNVSSTSLNVTWSRPTFVRGVLLAYEILYAGSDGSSQTVNKTDGFAASNFMVLDGLKINTVYAITLRGYTSAGPGIPATETGRTNEDAPPVIATFTVDQSDNGDLTLSWIPPSLENGDYHYVLSFTFVSAHSYKSRAESGNRTIVIGREAGGRIRTAFTMSNSSNDERVRSFASYDFSLSGCNSLFGSCNKPAVQGFQTKTTRATPVTSLSAVPIISGSTISPSFDIKLTWDLPMYPNGELLGYHIKYSSTVSTSSTTPVMVNISEHTFVLNTSSPNTYYTFTVTPAGGSVEGYSYNITERTNQTAPDKVENPSLLGVSFTCITVIIPKPSEITGVIRQLDLIVVGPTSENADSDISSMYGDISQTISGVRRAFTLTNPDGVTGVIPSQFGDFSPIDVCELRSNSRYLIFTRTEYFMDGTKENVVFSSPFDVTTQNSEVAAGTITFFILFFLLILIVVVAIVILSIMFRKRRKRAYTPPEIPLSQTESERPRLYVNMAIPPWSATLGPVSVKNFPDHVKRLHADEDYRFSEEFKNVEPVHSPTARAFGESSNTMKNRYYNIAAYDHSIVRLQPVEDVPGSDYINANYIDGYRSEHAFIATQGPVPSTVNDFWRLVWEQNSPSIVMLTNLEEMGKVKCHKYWPGAANTESYGEIEVKHEEEVELTEYTIRTFSLVKTDSHEERIVIQYHYTSWPDFGVPSYPTSLLLFVRCVSTNHSGDKGPMVVHCSAGVGRSGTFITLVSQLERIPAEDNVDIYGFVQGMRYQRCQMVQTEDQYIFIHDALLEAIECGMTEVHARDLPSHFKSLQARYETTGKTLLELELKRLTDSIHKKPSQDEGKKAFNRGKNRYADIIPYDTTRCKLSSLIGVVGSNYINANFINGYTAKKQFIATQGPLPDTSCDFWRLVWENKCHTVVMLTKEEEGGQVRCHRYWPEDEDMYGQIKVVHTSETTYPKYALREFKLSHTREEGSTLVVKHFQFLGWPEESEEVPEHGADFIDLFDQVQKWQRTAGLAPVLVHCSGGTGRTGTFITITNLLDRLNSEGVVDVFQTVRTLRLQRPHMVRNVGQYRYCYTTVLEYLQSFDPYANFK